MATYSSVLAWRIPWTEEPGWLQWIDCRESDETERLDFTNHILKRWIFVIIQFSRSVLSVTLRPHGLQHTRLPCPSPTDLNLGLGGGLNNVYYIIHN